MDQTSGDQSGKVEEREIFCQGGWRVRRQAEEEGEEVKKRKGGACAGGGGVCRSVEMFARSFTLLWVFGDDFRGDEVWESSECNNLSSINTTM